MAKSVSNAASRLAERIMTDDRHQHQHHQDFIHEDDWDEVLGVDIRKKDMAGLVILIVELCHMKIVLSELEHEREYHGEQDTEGELNSVRGRKATLQHLIDRMVKNWEE